jgi:glucokinase
LYLGIEIGGTKLQLGIGGGQGPPLAAMERLPVRPELGAEGIRAQLAAAARPLAERFGATAVGIGFGGPVDTDSGRTVTSHQIEGWTDFPLAEWCVQTLGLPTLLANDSDSAGLAEARFGAGRGQRVVFYSNVGSGIGGALVIDGQLYQGSGGIASELGHLRPGPECDGPQRTVESVSSGWAITAAVQRFLAEQGSGKGSGFGAQGSGKGSGFGVRGSGSQGPNSDAAGLLARCGGDPEQLNTQAIAAAALSGNRVAAEAIDRACRTYGWALAQMITLLAPGAVVLGGGVSLLDESLWLVPLRQYVRQYGFPPLADRFQLLPAGLGEEVVVHGVLALVKDWRAGGGNVE